MPTVTRHASSNSVGTTGFTNPGNAYASDDSYATAAPGVNSTISSYFGGFDFASYIPSGATINSVVIGIERKMSTTASSASTTQLAYDDATAIGTVQTSTAEPTSDTIWESSPSTLPTITQVRSSTFKVLVGAKRGSGATGYTMSLDDVYVTVDYTAPISGSADITLDAATLSAAGTVGSGSEISGTAAITLDDLTSSAAGTVDINGAAGISLEALTGSGAGTVDVQGSASISLDALTCSSAGTVANPSSDYSLVQSKSTIAGSADSVNISLDALPAIGDLVIVEAASWNGDLGSSAVTDNQGNTYTRQAYAWNSGTTTGVAIFSTVVATSSGTFTITFNPTGSSAEICLNVSEWSGNASSPVDQNNTNQSNGTSATTGSITPTEDNELLIAVMSHSSTDRTLTESNGTLLYENEGGTLNQPIAVAYKIQSTATSEGGAWTIGTGSVDWVACVASYKKGAGSSGINGTASITLDALTSSAAGTVDIAGAASITLDALTSSAAGTVDVAGAAAIQLDALVGSGTGTVDVAGTATIPLGAIELNATGTVGVAGAAAIVLGDLTCSADGTVGSTQINGEATITLDLLTANGAGTVDIAGLAAIALDGIGISTAGTVAVAGLASINLDGLTVVSAGTVAIAGTGAISLEAVTCSADGVVGFTPISGEAAITLGALTVSGAGTVEIAGAAGINLGEMALSAAGTISYVEIYGTAAISLDLLSSQASGRVEVAGASNISLDALLISAMGSVPASGILAVTFGNLVVSAAGQQGFAGYRQVTASVVQRQYSSQVVQRSNQASVIQRENLAGADQQELDAAVIQTLYDAESEDGL